MSDPHVVLELGHVLFGRRLLGERPGQHELGLEHRLGALDDSVQGGGHPRDRRMPDVALDVSDPPAVVALIPGSIELFRNLPQLHDEVAGQVLRLGLTPFFAPEAHESRFVAAHKDPSVGAAYEGATSCPYFRTHDFAPRTTVSNHR